MSEQDQPDDVSVEETWQEAEANPARTAAKAPLNNLKDDGKGAKLSPELEMILDIPVNLTMEVGQTEITIRNLLQLNQGSVIELDRLAGEPLDVKVNGTLIAKGEVVVVNDKFGLRLTDVVSPADRVKQLK